jgi:acyl-CoA synthetase (AMP-forming)/AMP-acid ligase II
MGRDALRLHRAEAGQGGDGRRAHRPLPVDLIAHYKCPRHVVFAELPKTSTGKIQKYVLREQAKAV